MERATTSKFYLPSSGENDPRYQLPGGPSSYNLLKDEEDSDNDESAPESTLGPAGLRKRLNKIAGAKVIQKTFQRHRVVYSQLGPSIFSRKGGSEADFGEIYFPQKNASAPFITVSDTTSANLLSTFMEKHWRLNRPEVFISVTGGAQDFALSSRMQRNFNKGLVSAAASTNAWVVTGGTDAGVMKLVAQAFAEGGSEVEHVPIIGVTPYGCVLGRDQLEGARGETRTYNCTEKASGMGAPINEFHSHFVFVDNGKVAPAAWGAEIGLRSFLESSYTSSKGVPLVLLVMQGGPGTLQTVLSMAQHKQAILIVRETGGAADAIADYVLKGKTDDPKFQSEKLQGQLKEILELHRASGELILSFYSITDDVELSSMLLTALIKTLRAPSKAIESAAEAEIRARALTLAVKWNRIDMGQKLLHQMSVEMKFTYGHHVALMFILERHRVELFQLITMSPEFNLHGINMCKLYYTCEDKYSVLDDANVQAGLKNNLASISNTMLDHKTGMPVYTFDLYKQIMAPFLIKLVPELKTVLETSDQVAAHDLFFWCILIGADDLMFEVWRHTETPVRCALLGAALARNMTGLMQFGRTECFDRARTLESWAVGLMDVVPTQTIGSRILSTKIAKWGCNATVDLAMKLEMKTFLSHKMCQSLMDEWWRGAYPGGSVQLRDGEGGVQLLLYVMFPPFNPYVHVAKAATRAKGRVLDFMHITEAVLHTYRLSKSETKRAGGTVEEIEIGKPKPARLEAILCKAQEYSAQEEARERQESTGAEVTSSNPHEGSLAQFYSVPAVKHVVRFIMHLILVTNMAQLLLSVKTKDEVDVSGVPGLSLSEVVFIFQATANVIDQWYQSMRFAQEGVQPTVSFGWLNKYGDSMLLFAFICRIFSFGGSPYPYITYQVLLSLVVVILMFRTMTYRTVVESRGVLVIMVEKMMLDVVLFGELMLFVTLGFMFAFIGLSGSKVGNDDVDALPALALEAGAADEGSVTGRMLRGGGSGGMPASDFQAELLVFWAIFGEFDLGYIEENVPFGQPVLFAYAFLSTLVLVNLLIAMFSDTYTNVKENSETEYRFQKKHISYLYQNIVHEVPPPFNLTIITPLVYDYYYDYLFGWLSKKPDGDTGGKSGNSLTGSGKNGASGARPSLVRKPSSKGSLRQTSSEAAAYMEMYIRAKTAGEDATLEGLAKSTYIKVEKMCHTEDQQIDLLKDMTKALRELDATVNVLKSEVADMKTKGGDAGGGGGPAGGEGGAAQPNVGEKLDTLTAQVAELTTQLAARPGTPSRRVPLNL